MYTTDISSAWRWNGVLLKWLRVAWQVGLLTLIWQVGNLIASWSGLPIPGTVIGVVLLLVMLGLKVIRLEWVEDGAGWLQREMALFFVPAAIGAIQYKRVLATSGLRLAVIILLGTMVVMAVTGVVVEALGRRKAGESA